VKFRVNYKIIFHKMYVFIDFEKQMTSLPIILILP
jgi:hypothetical protein